MLQSEQIALLDKLRFSDRASERNQALRDLKLIEMEGQFDEDDLLRLLEEKDFVFQTYAIGAIGRLKIKKGIPALCKVFEESNDPLTLPSMLETFLEFKSSEFVDCVSKKLIRLSKLKNTEKTGNQLFLLEQIIVPALKYFQTCGNEKVTNIVQTFLHDPDATIRWHALMTYDKLGLSITDEELNALVSTDNYALVREQASVMLEKRKAIS